MEPKSGSRTTKKSAGGGALGDRKKAKQKKKKEKRKASVKGTESTDVPSPELDSEALLDGDVTLTTDQEGQFTPTTGGGGQVTRLPQLSSQTSVSLTTSLTPSSTPPPHHLQLQHHHLLSRKSQLAREGGGHLNSNSAPASRTTSSSTSTAALITLPNNLDGVVARVAHLNIKQRASNKSRSGHKAGGPGASSKTSGGKASRSKETRSSGSNARGGGGTNKVASSSDKGGSQGSGNINTGGGGSSGMSRNESLRWELAVENVEEERERIALYKMNRRKRYLAAAQAKGLGWAMNYYINNNSSSFSGSQTNLATPLSEDSGVEMACCGSPSRTLNTTTTTTTNMATTSSSTAVGGSASSSCASAGAFIDFSSMQTLRPLPVVARSGLQEAFVEC